MLPDLTDLNTFRSLLKQAPGPDRETLRNAADRNAQLTKPPGALGRLEDLAIWYAGWRGDARPSVTAPQVVVFAANHGVAAQGVSAFPAAVTGQMVANFRAGGAAINQLARACGARLDVLALDLDRPTADFTLAPAMSGDDCLAALRAGWGSVDPASDLLVVGEMGIGNTTSAAAICHALYGGEAADWTGRGTGIDDAGLRIKTGVVARGVARQAAGAADGLDLLARLGGREIAAMAGAIAAARVLRIPVVLDGFICCTAAACLHDVCARALDHAVAGHQSDESAHAALLERLGKAPLLSLGLRLGEGSGGALAVNIVKAAVACHSGMATFDEAGVTGG
ncbi:nicotinate-nucleotide--dimethylbenzimidazole phosphoribosyltransferase [Sedimentitalea sp. JM2-8]|uniref:Nicotinate-nucleotide--dimethylbenzimidazole phosphoribosyltransferase n=1 Tax=Sedimentitalea xiamensis TaxID=3050037 RepID=A0ABT7FD37_9RHOB|nr:nicotinate-nucleotide--dimethylbenzimidazole phosphoribosyltransferase [Sedimentitalea xiamensis]MDK3073028.1 nicotinate-nucleotide--dimethylbenzimidazole phosphoribosyltransferase [Sedimentitalea xiamensis]